MGGPDNGAQTDPTESWTSRFNFLLALEVQKSRRLQYSVSIVCMFDKVREGKSSLGPLAPRVIHHLRSTDVALELLSSSLALLLIHADTVSLPSIVHRLIDHLQGFVPHGATLSWSAGAAYYPLTAGGAEELLEQARGLMVQAADLGLPA